MTYDIRYPNAAVIQIVGNAAELKEWQKRKTIFVPGYKYTPAYRQKRWNGKHSPGRFKGPKVAPWFELSRGFLHEFLEPGYAPPIPEEELPLLQEILQRETSLRDYQKTAIFRILQHRWSRIHLATNAGKGAIIALLTEILVQTGNRILILCDEIAVFDALESEIHKWSGIRVAKVKAGTRKMPHEPIVLAMVPSLYRKITNAQRVRNKIRKIEDEEGTKIKFIQPELLDDLKAAKAEDKRWRIWIGTFQGVLCDEADKASAKSWKTLLKSATDSVTRVGFSGTFPKNETYEDLIMDELFGPITMRVKNADLIDRKISAKPTVLLRGFDCRPALPRYPKNWYSLTGAEKRLWVMENAILFNFERHEFLASLIRPDIPTCIVVNRIDHGTSLAEMLEGSIFLSGAATDQQRKETLSAFARGDFSILIVTKILDRGTNRLGHAVDLIFASGEGSNRQTLQRIGRGLRRADGKEFLNLIDIMDRGHKYLEKGATRRIQVYGQEEFEVRVEA